MLNDYKLFTTKSLLFNHNQATANLHATFYKHQASGMFICRFFKIMFTSQ